ncbi:MAG: hypothetical protein LQ350_004009 [Teloschistes chrysophthalmus]|nr:MAG: hypothetical protein LQ350_004009 [Niorma chrysophthalma]
MSKRTASDQELALPSPEATKACLQKAQDNMSSDTPFDDDLDDIYGDSPAVPQHPNETIPPPVVVAAPQYSLPGLQYSNVQLPGLSSTAQQWSGLEPSTNAHTETIPLDNEPAKNPSTSLEQQALDPYASEQHFQNGHEDSGATNGLHETGEPSGQAPMRMPDQREVSAIESATIEGAVSSGTHPGPSQKSAESAISITAPSEGTDVPVVGSQDDGQEVHITGDTTRHAPQNQQLEQSEMMDTAPDVSGSQVQDQKNPGSNHQQVRDPSVAASNARASPFDHTPVGAAPKSPEKTQTLEAEPGKSSNEVDEGSKNNGEAEFELDSSPIESSSESESDSSSSSSGDSDYEMLDPEEEARRLMQEDGGSEDEGKGGRSAAEPLRTLNEKPEEIIPKPQIEVTPAMSTLELGNVEHIVEASILIKATRSGESRALETGSLLCLGDRSVIGVVAEILGQVQQPYYSVRFTNPAAIAETGISKGTPIFYVEQHSSYVFTQNLKALKGSDASNMHDEEVGDDEMEFSDDEAEAEYKRRMKQEKLARKGGRGGREDGLSKPSRGGRGGRRGGYSNQSFDARTGAGPPPINYDDNDDGDDLYTPLARPSNLHEIMGRGEAPQEDLNSRNSNGVTGGSEMSQFGRTDRGRDRGRGGRGDRGGRGRGRGGGRGDRRAGGGGFQHDSRNENGQYDYHSSQHHQPHQQHALPSPVHADHYPSFPNQDYSGYQPPPQPSSTWPTPTHWPYNKHTTPNNSNNNNFSPPPSYQQPTYTYQHQQPQPQHQSYQNYNNPYHQPTQPQSPYQYPPPHSPHNNNNIQQYNHNNIQAAAGQQSPTTPSVPPNIPPGAHINPAFFAQQQAYPPPPPVTGNEGGRGGREAFRAAQEKLEMLRGLSRGAGGGDGV